MTVRGALCGLKWLARNQVSLRSLILVFCFASRFGGTGVTMGLPPQTPLGDFIPKPHLRFAAV